MMKIFKVTIFVWIVMLLISCGCFKKTKEVELYSAKVEKVNVESNKAKTHTFHKSYSSKKDTIVNNDVKSKIHVVFNPIKKSDSLSFLKAFKGDTLKLSIKGNGKVDFTMTSTIQKNSKLSTSIVGSETLGNIESFSKLSADSTSTVNKSLEKIEKSSTSLSRLYWVFKWGLVVCIILFVLFIIFKKYILLWLKI